jgi:D-apiose dehydrogenase
MTQGINRPAGLREHAPLRVGIIGAGMISRHHLIGWSRLGDDVRVVAVCDPDLARANQRAEEFGIAAVAGHAEAMLDEHALDVLDIISPRETHARYVELAADRGIDVLCQKPLTPTLAEAATLIRRVNGRIRLMVHENWRFRPWYRELSEWLRAGDLGHPLYAGMTMLSSGLLPDRAGQRPALMRQPFMAHEARLMLTEVLIHHLDVLRWLMGPLRVIGARAARTIPEVKGDTLASVFLETPTGSPVVLTGTMAAPGLPARTDDHLQLVGSEASAFLAGTELRRLGSQPASQSFDFAQGYQASFDGVIAHFVECLRSGASFETDAADNIETLRLVEHAYWAAGLHRPEWIR